MTDTNDPNFCRNRDSFQFDVTACHPGFDILVIKETPVALHQQERRRRPGSETLDDHQYIPWVFLLMQGNRCFTTTVMHEC